MILFLLIFLSTSYLYANPLDPFDLEKDRMGYVLLDQSQPHQSYAHACDCSDLTSFVTTLGGSSVYTLARQKVSTPTYPISERIFYFGTGIALETVALLARLGGGICSLFPWSSTLGKECFFLGKICSSAAEHVFKQMLKKTSASSPLLRGVPSSQFSWYLNHLLLSKIPTFSPEQKKLLLFLEKRWLAKSTGFFPVVIDWICPCFGISMQVHPQTTSCYARSPWIKLSQTYKSRVEEWKKSLPHPENYPLILTRPCDLQDYLPSYHSISCDEQILVAIQKIALKVERTGSKAVLDLTSIFPPAIYNRKEWLQIWQYYQDQIAQICQEYKLNLNQIICIQRLKQEEIGGIRLLPLKQVSAEKVAEQDQFLLEWISNFGLSANRVELDRYPIPSGTDLQRSPILSCPKPLPTRQELIHDLKTFEQKWKSNHLQKTFLLKSTLKVLQGLLTIISEEKWNEIANCPTRSSIAELSFLRIKKQLDFLAQTKDETLFFNTASQIEQIHADLSNLLEIFNPFTFQDFPKIYHDLLLSIPHNLQPLTSYGIHSSGMTSLAGILKATERTLGRAPRVLYGENTYFECINAVNLVSKASSIQEAAEADWKDVDLILAQFNPVLKRIDLKIDEYRVEEIAKTLRKALNARQGKPLTLALDSTLDFIHSSRVDRLLTEFEKEIEAGVLNFICFRSGLKFDLFGMDNYCGAPFYMIHNRDAKWKFFDAIPTDPVLQTDQLSLNWFCLAYQSVAPELELYRKQIFDNTRALLNKLPSRLLSHQTIDYRVIPVEQQADPAFIDIKISGALHQIRGAALVGGYLYLTCMEGGHPIFYRPSLGFYHPNFTMLFSKECTTIRLTVGLDPAQVDLLARCFETIDTLNRSLP